MTAIDIDAKDDLAVQLEMLLEKGEHLQLLEMVREGQITPDQLSDLVRKNEKRHWLRYKLRNLILGIGG